MNISEKIEQLFGPKMGMDIEKDLEKIKTFTSLKKS